MNKPLVINDSDSNDDTIADWVAANAKYLPHFILVSTKKSSRPVVLANQVRFTASTKHIAIGLGSAVAVIGVGFTGGNGVGSGGEVKVVLIAEIGVSFNSNYNIGSNVEIDIVGDLRNAEVCLGVMPATAAGSAFSWLNIAMPISSISRSHLTLVSSMVQVDQASKTPVLFSHA